MYGGTLPVSSDLHCPPLPSILRNTKAIHEFVSVFYKAEEKPSSKGPVGRPPEILGYPSDEDLVHLLSVVLTNLVDGEKVPLEDIVILTPSRKEKSGLRQRERVDGFRLSERVEPGTVLTSSVHSFKGERASPADRHHRVP